MKKAGKIVLRGMGLLEESVSISMLSITMIVTILNVFARYLLKNSFPWAQEVTGIAWTWTVMLGISWCYRRNMHMGVDFVVEKLTPVLKRYVHILAYAILLVSFLFMTYMSVIITMNGAYKLTSYFKLPYSYKYVSAVISFLFMSVYSLRYLVMAIKAPQAFVQCVSIEGNGLDDLDFPEERSFEEGKEEYT